MYITSFASSRPSCYDRVFFLLDFHAPVACHLPFSFAQNAVAISSYIDDPSDRELFKIMPFLNSLVHAQVFCFLLWRLKFRIMWGVIGMYVLCPNTSSYSFLSCLLRFIRTSRNFVLFIIRNPSLLGTTDDEMIYATVLGRGRGLLLRPDGGGVVIRSPNFYTLCGL